MNSYIITGKVNKLFNKKSELSKYMCDPYIDFNDLFNDVRIIDYFNGYQYIKPKKVFLNTAIRLTEINSDRDLILDIEAYNEKIDTERFSCYISKYKFSNIDQVAKFVKNNNESEDYILINKGEEYKVNIKTKYYLTKMNNNNNNRKVDDNRKFWI